MPETLNHGRALARHAATWQDREIPADVALKTRLHVIDTLSAIVSGATLEAGRAGQAYVAGLGGRGSASVLGTALRVPLIEAALANGMAAHADESDDSHETSQTHPGCGVLPAALSVAEEVGASGEAFLRAVNLGYEMTIRFGEAMAPAMSFARSSLSCHAWGPLFGAGFAAGNLMKFDEDQYLVLLNYLVQEASGLTTWRLDRAHTLKSYVFAGMPASNAVKVAALVRAGFTGAGDVLSPADRNFFDAMPADMQPAALYRGLGRDFRILETDIKKYSVGFPIAAPISALEDILARANPQPDAITAVRIRYAQDWYKVIGDENGMPDLNLRYCLAVTILDNGLSFAASHDESRMKAPDVKSLGQKITFLPPDADQDRFEARVEVDTPAGTLTARQGLHVLGRKDNPMSALQIEAKALELFEMALSPAQARVLVTRCHELPDAPNIHQLIAATIPDSAR
ncbi:MmgE/PrpD family protein [Roseicitreum antarcticum]|uniref:2-methylcitrate dehydratase PrpD n=1 Tax=Roseicitreum antarcticum TaxID=564137 RepID=A0A1H2YMT8_9RHOB|nr:MmgE/PrpD family protein [Roseicitreum antarcticum]SDX05839.1 2-methylcitrate dehydratase PrpD [Roseicitreum antarcticum]